MSAAAATAAPSAPEEAAEGADGGGGGGDAATLHCCCCCRHAAALHAAAAALPALTIGVCVAMTAALQNNPQLRPGEVPFVSNFGDYFPQSFVFGVGFASTAALFVVVALLQFAAMHRRLCAEVAAPRRRLWALRAARLGAYSALLSAAFMMGVACVQNHVSSALHVSLAVAFFGLLAVFNFVWSMLSLVVRTPRWLRVFRVVCCAVPAAALLALVGFHFGGQNPNYTATCELVTALVVMINMATFAHELRGVRVALVSTPTGAPATPRGVVLYNRVASECHADEG